MLVTLLPDDFDALVAELRERQRRSSWATSRPTSEGNRYTGFADPDGNLFEITGA